MLITIALAAMLASTPAVPQPKPVQQQVRQTMLAEPTKVYELTDKKRK